jgi:hypothetical protein
LLKAAPVDYGNRNAGRPGRRAARRANAALAGKRGGRSALGAPIVDVVDRLLDGGDLLGFFIRDLDLELLFEGHDQLNGIQRVSAEVIDE